MNEIPGLLPPMSGLTDEQRRRLTILRAFAAGLGLISERDARYHHDDEKAMDAPYMIVRDMLFCSYCDYAISKIERETARYPVRNVCPRCGQTNMTQFYSVGSQTHRERREAWERGESPKISLGPPVFIYDEKRP